MNTSPTPEVRLQRAERHQMSWMEGSLDQLLPPDHVARVVWAYVEGLDVSPLLAEIKAVAGGPGQPAIDPRVLLALWLLATLEGVGSARQLDRLCEQHLAYRWICGGVTVNYHTLSDFRVESGAFFSQLLTESVATLMHQGLVELHEVAQDGMRVRAHAGAKTFRRQPSLKKCLAEARRQVEALRKQDDEDDGAVSRREQAARERAGRERYERVAAALREQKKMAERHEQLHREKGTRLREARASTTDPEARRMLMSDGGWRPGYNVELATDTRSGLVVGVDVINVGSDSGQLRPMAEQIERRFGAMPRRMLVDGNFAHLDDIEHLGGTKAVDVIAPIKNEATQKAQGSDPYQAKRRDGPAVAAWRMRMGTPAAQEAYKRRASTAEWVHARLRNMGLRQFVVRGLRKVRAVSTLFALAHNLMQLRTRRWAPATG
jgi:transposase